MNNGKLAIITGGASPPGNLKGIGKATAALFKASGYEVVIGDIDEEAGKATAEELEITYIYTDVRSYGASENFLSTALALARRTHIDVLIANAGDNDGLSTAEATPEQWGKSLILNLTGAYNLIRPALPHLKDGASRVILVASLVGVVGQLKNGPYTAAKAGLIGWAKSLALELAPRRIPVNVISPHATRTPMCCTKWAHTQPEGADAAMEKLRASIPLGELVEPEDVAELALFLASVTKITGQNFIIDGGASLG